MKLYIDNVYSRLLADVCLNTGVPLGAPEEISYGWLVNDAPKLDKQLLRWIEGDSGFPEFPEWLMPLAEEFHRYANLFALHGLPNDSKRSACLLRGLRQLLVFCYKVETRPTDEQIRSSVKEFEETDHTVGVWKDAFNSDPSRQQLMCSARKLVNSVIYRINWKEITPSHGPGGVYPSCKPWQKSDFTTDYSSITSRYPLCEYFIGIPSFWWDNLVKRSSQWVDRDEIVAKLIPVPKDSRGPRLIAVHPKEAIWIQQGQRRLLESAILNSRHTRGSINFRDQTVNQRLALESSKTREFCTLDLKEASDRVSTALVRNLFGDYAYDWISCTRATKCELPDGRVIGLEKWAPMGNALCFPVESLIFWALVKSAIASKYGENCTEIYVFGDDLVFPVKYYHGVIEGLIRAGLVPNLQKTFVHGYFRESCGVEAFLGYDVTPLRARKGDLSTLGNIVSWLDLAKRLRLAGYETCASYIYATVRKETGYLPMVNNPDTSGLVEYVDRTLGQLLLREPRVEWHEGYQQYGVRARLVKSPVYRGPTGSWYYLQDSLLRIGNLADVASDRGTEYPIPYRVQLEYGWTPIL